MPATEQIEKEYCQYFDIKIYNIVIVNYISPLHNVYTSCLDRLHCYKSERKCKQHKSYSLAYFCTAATCLLNQS